MSGGVGVCVWGREEEEGEERSGGGGGVVLCGGRWCVWGGRRGWLQTQWLVTGVGLVL